jgi:proteasome alpha subunit
MRGYSYDRKDVTGRGLANAYAQTLGSIFSSGGEKPYEVEIFVGEVGPSAELDQVYRLTYDGQVNDEQGFAAMGGSAESVTTHIKEHYRSGMTLAEAITLAVDALGHSESAPRVIPVTSLEVAVLDRTRSQQRKFKRLTDPELADILGQRDGDGGPQAGGTTPTDSGPEDGGVGASPDPDPPVAPPVS